MLFTRPDGHAWASCVGKKGPYEHVRACEAQPFGFSVIVDKT